MRKITEIIEIDNHKMPDDDWGRYEGYIIKTSTGENLTLAISSGQSCCENYGYACTEDNIQDFIGAELQSYEIVDDELAVKTNRLVGDEFYDQDYICSDAGETYFLNVITSAGALQFVVYNQHNGYYGHHAKIQFGSEVLLDEHI